MTTELRLGDQVIEYERELTVAAYQNIAEGGALICGCDGCRNFAAQRQHVYPAQFLELCRQLGIDPNKEGEVWDCPADRIGVRYYGGWLYLVGRLVAPGQYLVDIGNFRYYFGTSFPRPPAAFAPHPVLTVEFFTTLPWILE